MSDSLWFNRPSILIHEKYIHEWYPQLQLGKNRNINAVTRLIILLTSLTYILTMKFSYLMSGIISLILIYLIASKSKEGLKVKSTNKAVDASQFASPVDNPLKNPLIGEPPQEESAPMAYEETETINDNVKKMIQEQNSSIDNIDSKLFKDLGESFEFDRSMRQFYSTANTTVPNDQESFANFCYGDMTSAKEGNQSALLKRTNQLHAMHL